MSSSETVLGRFVSRVESQYRLPEFSQRAWQALLAPGANKFAVTFDWSALAAVFESSRAWTNCFVRAVQHRELGAADVSDVAAGRLAKLDRQVVTGLVYGFGLPELLLSEIGAELAARYWQRTLIRAMAVRIVARRLERVDGDGMFASAMVADVGSLVLLQELKQTYVQFIEDAETHGHDLYQMELDTLGFDQRVLAARLLDRWSAADLVVRTVGDASGGEAEVPSIEQAPQLSSDDLRRFVFQAGDLLSELLGGRLSVKRGQERITRLTRIARQVFRWELVDFQRWAAEVVESARYLADCFGVQIGEPESLASRFEEVWNAESHRERQQSASPVKPVIPPVLVKPGAAPGIPLPKLAESVESNDWLGGLGLNSAGERTATNPASRSEMADRSALAVLNEPVSLWLSDHSLNGQVQNWIEICRSRRQSLSLKLAQIDQFESMLFGGTIDEVYQIQQSLLTGFEQLVSGDGGRVIELGDDKFGFLLPGLDRTSANRIGQEVLRAVRQWSSNRQQKGKIGLTLSLGCASTEVPARNLRASSLIEAAARCLENVQRSAGNGLKSIDLYY